MWPFYGFLISDGLKNPFLTHEGSMFCHLMADS